MSAVQCTIQFSDGHNIQRSTPVSGNSDLEFLDNLASSLTALKEDINIVLTEQVEKEKKQPSHLNKRDTPDDEGSQYY